MNNHGPSCIDSSDAKGSLLQAEKRRKPAKPVKSTIKSTIARTTKSKRQRYEWR
jgi:hypothetical protein